MNSRNALNSFLKGLYTSLNASMQTFEEMSASSKGAGREDSVKAILKACLPSKYSIISGDIIDTKEKSTGQIDGIAVYSSALILKAPVSEVCLVPAESAGAVFEVKSSLSSQWGEVLEKFRKVEPILWKPVNMLFTRSEGGPRRETMSFHVIAHKGYKDVKTLKSKLEELIGNSQHFRVMSILTLDPPAIVLVREEKEMGIHIGPSSPEGVIGQWLSYVVGDMNSYFNPKPNIGKYFDKL
jgi:hypothetical protein